MIIIVDCKMGNLGSIQNMLRKLGEEPLITDDPEKNPRRLGPFATTNRTTSC